jgi:hypothetical protein
MMGSLCSECPVGCYVKTMFRSDGSRTSFGIVQVLSILIKQRSGKRKMEKTLKSHDGGAYN